MKSHAKRTTFWLISLIVMLLLMSGPSTALATDGNLPGGTSISVDITAPSDGAIKVSPPGSIDLEGTASVAEGVIVKDTTVVFVMDISDSMNDDAGVDCDGVAGTDSRLVCEKEAVVAANTASKAATSSVDLTGLASFHGNFADQICISTAHDVDLGTGGAQLLVDPGLDGNNAGGADIEEVAQGLGTGGATCYIGGLERADDILATSDNAVNLVFFMSDGFNNTGDAVNTFSPANFGSNTRIHAFAMGAGVDCSTDNFGVGSLDDVVAESTLAGGSCQQVTDLSELAGLITEALGSSLDSIERQLDGGAWVDISASASSTLPADGPTGVVTFGEADISAGPGVHELCVRATGTDGGGSDSVVECITVTVVTIELTPDTETNELGTPGQTHTVTALLEAGADGGVAGGLVNFEILSGPNDAVPDGSDTTDANGEATFTYTATQGPAGLGTDVIQACFGPDEQGDTICDTAEKDWVDTTPPDAECNETVNPHGGTVPPAGSTTLPGPMGGQNEDGFYELLASDAVWPDDALVLWLTDEAGNVFGPFSVGDKIKYTESEEEAPVQKKIGSANGQAGAVSYHIIGVGDVVLTAIDGSGNVSDPVACLVPPPPK